MDGFEFARLLIAAASAKDKASAESDIRGHRSNVASMLTRLTDEQRAEDVVGGFLLDALENLQAAVDQMKADEG